MSDQPNVPPITYLGTTVYEVTLMRINQINRLRAELLVERERLEARALQYSNSLMLESERIATRAEPYQTTQLPAE